MQMDITKPQNTVVILAPIRRVARRYIDLSKERRVDVADIETLILSTVSANWNEYLNDIEVEMNDKVCKDHAMGTIGRMTDSG